MRAIRNEFELGAALRARRVRAGLTQADVAARAGVSRAFVIDVEKGRRPRAELNRVLGIMRTLDAAIELIDHREPAVDDVLARLLGGGE